MSTVEPGYNIGLCDTSPVDVLCRTSWFVTANHNIKLGFNDKSPSHDVRTEFDFNFFFGSSNRFAM
jgi:hypothetical protein